MPLYNLHNKYVELIDVYEQTYDGREIGFAIIRARKLRNDELICRRFELFTDENNRDYFEVKDDDGYFEITPIRYYIDEFKNIDFFKPRDTWDDEFTWKYKEGDYLW